MIDDLLNQKFNIALCACGQIGTHKRAGTGVNAKPWECKSCYETNSRGGGNCGGGKEKNNQEGR